MFDSSSIAGKMARFNGLTKCLVAGNGTPSRAVTPSKNQKLRSLWPYPAVGAMPYSNISMKSMSSICASLSPESRSACCSRKRSSCSTGSFSSE
ncbi:hypothetical protein [Candidatus Microthrix parvicella]|uniref:hypothetical protein n=1 Tax=Candidatus Neomicrothrix parvicella TaxID=41950 RepID=UPI001EE65F1C|nr:hypothetical protein [Candidatus Microthrix parvicella]